MNYRVKFVLTKIIWIFGVGMLYLFFSAYLPMSTGVPTVTRERSGPILFWQQGALYTINDDGTYLRRISPAAEADEKRQIAISGGCTGMVDAGCYVLVKHVLYDALGHGIPLPITNNYRWINAPAAWAPDGTHIAYFVSNVAEATWALLVYDVQQQVVWQVADKIDSSVVPAWSAACTNLTSDDCCLAYAVKTPPGESGNRIAVKSLNTGNIRVFAILSGRGHVLRWSKDDLLYYGGGDLGWFSAITNAPLETHGKNVTVSAPSPDMMHLAYNTVPTPHQPAELWLQATGNEGDSRRLYIFKNDDSDERSAPQQILWADDGNSFLAFDQGELIHYNIQHKTAVMLYRNDATQVFENYAFSPLHNGVALVEKTITLYNPKYRLFVVSETGEVTTLLPSTQQPMVLLAWLPGNFAEKLLPTYENDLL